MSTFPFMSYEYNISYWNNTAPFLLCIPQKLLYLHESRNNRLHSGMHTKEFEYLTQLGGRHWICNYAVKELLLHMTPSTMRAKDRRGKHNCQRKILHHLNLPCFPHLHIVHIISRIEICNKHSPSTNALTAKTQSSPLRWWSYQHTRSTCPHGAASRLASKQSSIDQQCSGHPKLSFEHSAMQWRWLLAGQVIRPLRAIRIDHIQ
jgi:hypothetical protein